MKLTQQVLRVTTSFILFMAVISQAHADTKSFTAYAVEMGGVKFWIPSTFTVKKGDVVKFHLVNKVPGAKSVHGFALDDFKIQEVVDATPKEVEFTADKAG